MKRGPRLISVCIAAAALAAGQSHAQTAPDLRGAAVEDEVEQPVQRKPRQVADPYAPSGVKAGAMTFYPSLAIGGFVTTNAAKSAASAKNDMALRLRPSLRFESDWSRHAWSGAASGDFLRYDTFDDLNAQGADVSSRYRLDIRRHTRVEFDAGYNRDDTGIEDSEVPDTAIGQRTDHRVAAAAALIHDFGAFEARLKAASTWRTYGDVKLAGGGKEDNSDRDYVSSSLSLRATYTEPPALKPFVEVGYAPRIHDREFDRNGLRRDSHGLSASLGVTLAREPIWSGDVALTYQVRDYEDPALDTVSAVGVDALLAWSPSELTRIVLEASTTLDETALATSSAARNWRFGVSGRHALRKNVDLVGSASIEFERDGGATDTTIDAGIGLEWQLNPSLAWTAGYDATWFNAASGADYEEHRVSAGVILRR